MVRIAPAALCAAIIFSLWTAPASSEPQSYLTAEGPARMMEADGIKEQWQTAEQICAEQGLETGSPAYESCFAEYRIFSLRALRAKARALTDAVAKQHGLCIDREKFEISRCKEI